MTQVNLLWFAALVGVVLVLLLWRIIRAEDGHGFMPVSQGTALALASVFFEAISIACFVACALLLMRA